MSVARRRRCWQSGGKRGQVRAKPRCRPPRPVRPADGDQQRPVPGHGADTDERRGRLRRAGTGRPRGPCDPAGRQRRAARPLRGFLRPDAAPDRRGHRRDRSGRPVGAAVWRPAGAYFRRRCSTPYDTRLMAGRSDRPRGIVVFTTRHGRPGPLRLRSSAARKLRQVHALPDRLGAGPGHRQDHRRRGSPPTSPWSRVCETLKFGSLCALAGSQIASGDERDPAFPGRFSRGPRPGRRRSSVMARVLEYDRHP